MWACVHVCVCVLTRSMAWICRYVEFGGEFLGVSSFLTTHGSHGYNSGSQSCAALLAQLASFL